MDSSGGRRIVPVPAFHNPASARSSELLPLPLGPVTRSAEPLATSIESPVKSERAPSGVSSARSSIASAGPLRSAIDLGTSGGRKIDAKSAFTRVVDAKIPASPVSDCVSALNPPMMPAAFPLDWTTTPTARCPARTCGARTTIGSSTGRFAKARLKPFK